MVDGMLPDSLLPKTCKSARLVRFLAMGNEPVRQFEYRYKAVRDNRVLKVEGIAP